MKETHVATNASQTEASPEARHVFSLFVDFYFCVKKVLFILVIFGYAFNFSVLCCDFLKADVCMRDHTTCM